jgi:hypothetical protein
VQSQLYPLSRNSRGSTWLRFSHVDPLETAAMALSSSFSKPKPSPVISCYVWPSPRVPSIPGRDARPKTARYFGVRTRPPTPTPPPLGKGWTRTATGWKWTVGTACILYLARESGLAHRQAWERPHRPLTPQQVFRGMNRILATLGTPARCPECGEIRQGVCRGRKSRRRSVIRPCSRAKPTPKRSNRYSKRQI